MCCIVYQCMVSLRSQDKIHNEIITNKENTMGCEFVSMAQGKFLGL